VANSILTPTQVVREALRVLHQKLTFVGSINRQYDKQFGDEGVNPGGKIGPTLQIRLPNQYSIRQGATLSAQDTTESSVALTVSKQVGVDMNFTSVDLTLSLQDFSDRIIDPAMAVLAANIEADALSMFKSVYNQVNNQASAATFAKYLAARKILVDNLTPAGPRTVCLNTQDYVDTATDLKGSFNPQESISKIIRDGYLGRASGFDFAENTLLVPFTPGARSGYLVNGANQTGSTLAVNTGTGAIAQGEVFTMAGVFRVHPETKAVTNVLQQFVVTAAYAGGAGNISISPAIVTSGAAQNVSASPTSGGAVTFAGTASTAHGISLAYHKDAFAFVTAPLQMPKGVDFASRQTMDGISMRIVRDYDIVNDKFPTRVDVLYGYAAIRPQLACRLANN
jgi:hypothetical protein